MPPAHITAHITAEDLLPFYLHRPSNRSTILSQLTHRLALASHFPLPQPPPTPSTPFHILDIGCGQGDTTLVLAALHPTAHITAIDPGPPNYGSPFPLGTSQAHIAASPHGTNIDFVHADPITHLATTPPHKYDLAVLCHSAWYFAEPGVLRDVFVALTGKARRVVVAEWALEARRVQAVPHVLAAMANGVLGAIEGELAEGQRNIETPLAAAGIARLAQEAGWVGREVGVVVPGDELDDGRWEVGDVLGEEFQKRVRKIKDKKTRATVEAIVDAVRLNVEVIGGVPNVCCMTVRIQEFVLGREEF